MTLPIAPEPSPPEILSRIRELEERNRIPELQERVMKQESSSRIVELEERVLRQDNKIFSLEREMADLRAHLRLVAASFAPLATALGR